MGNIIEQISAYMRKTRSVGSIKNTIEEAEKEASGKFQFINPTYSKHLNCPKCKKMMRNPMRLHPCAHTLCSACIPKKGKCPVCSTNFRASQKDLIGEAMINEMTVRCLNNDCPFKGTYDEFKKFHLTQCKLSKGLDQWMRNMKATLEQHNSPPKHYSDDEQYAIQAEDKGFKRIPSLQKPKQAEKLNELQKQLLQKHTKPLQNLQQ